MQQATGNWQQQPVSLAHLSRSLVPCRRLQFVTQSELYADVDYVSLQVQAESEN